MRTLRKDYARYSKEEEGDDMVTFINMHLLTGVHCSIVFITCQPMIALVLGAVVVFTHNGRKKERKKVFTHSRPDQFSGQML